ncbi:MAG: CCA tRNA nucleotidyltransferase [Atopobiaceae bacterium]
METGLSEIGPELMPSYAGRVLSALEDAGYEAWIVGGWVRDALRGDAAHDVDITTSAHWQETERVLRASGIEVHETGTKHGTVTAVVEGQPIECTTYRTEGTYTDLRHPDSVTFVDNVREDLARRDFTINAMAWHPARGLLDPFGGRKDLTRGLVRAVGDPEKRFSEDALRILRAVRFAARFGFAIEPATQKALVACASELREIAQERRGQELTGILASGRTSWALTVEPEVLRAAVPELEQLDEKAYERTAACAAAVEELSGGMASSSLRWAALFPEAGPKAAKRALKRMAIGVDTAQEAASILKLGAQVQESLEKEPSWTEQKSYELAVAAERACSHRGIALSFGALAYVQAETLAKGSCTEIGRDHVRQAIEACDRVRSDIRVLAEEKAPLRVQELAVGGSDLMDELSIPAGPELGKILNALFSRVMAGDVANEHEALLAEARRMKQMRS